MDKHIRPFLKWAGSKYAILDRIKQVIPESGNRLIEPFVGSGAFFLNTNYKKYIIADNNQDLIDVYLQLQQEGQSFIDYCAKVFTPEYNQAEKYYEMREQFNTIKDKRQKARLFFYLNRHGYNGLCRYNSKGGYNVPFGRYTQPFFPTESMQHAIDKLDKTKIQACDFEEIFKDIKKGDVVYCDPPYVSLSETAKFNFYNGQIFGEPEQENLAQCAENANNKGAIVVISNHDTEFTRKIYKKAEIIDFNVGRKISCNALKRNQVGELMAVYR